MAFSTPTYDYGRQTSDLSIRKGTSDVARNLGQFFSQERHRRDLEGLNRTFKDRFPQVGSSYNQRGLYHSGLRRAGQRREAEDYQRGVTAANIGQAENEIGMMTQAALSDAEYQQGLLQLFEDLQKARATGVDPFAAIRGVLS
jgi:hypothetical protein